MSDSDSLDLTYVEGRSDTTMFAIGAILAALYGLGSLIPISVFIGATASISLTLVIAPLFGVLLGPWRGSLFGLVGGVIVFLIGGSGGLFQVIPIMILGPGISGLLTGLCATPQIRGKWIPASGLTAGYIYMIIILYEIENHLAWWFVLYYVLALFVALGLQLTDTQLEIGDISKRGILKLIPFLLIGTITEFSMMTLGAVYILHLPPAFFGFVAFPLMLFERTIAIIISLIIAVAVLKAFPQIWQKQDIQ
ncbi:MAG: hypothetical protein JW779_14315 [Candidatus Thorarchaeota archaeon]|nr:hypothetical protein [Candidatus Thorarchaeota archaeon]